jgi:hypothetical protein
VVRELRPLATLAGRALSRSQYELFGPASVTLAPAKEGLRLVYTLDGKQPKKGGTTYAQPLEIVADSVLRARYFAQDEPVGAETAIRFVVRPLPGQNLLGLWSADRLKDTTMINDVAHAASDLKLPDGTAVVDDPAQGKVLRLDHSSKVMLDNPAILANELTLSFRIKTASDATLVRYGYAHTGIFLNISKSGSINASGGRVYHAAETKGGVLNDGKWHQLTATYGGSPFRQIEAWIDGVKLASGRSSAPCLTKELEFLQGFTGDLAEIRMYNRILSPDEISALSRGLGNLPAVQK